VECLPSCVIYALSEAKDLHFMLTFPVQLVSQANLLFSAHNASSHCPAADFRPAGELPLQG
jgi:hypothetical protein